MTHPWPRRLATMALTAGCGALLASGTALAGPLPEGAEAPITEVHIDQQITAASPTSYIQDQDPTTVVYHDEAGGTTAIEQTDDYVVSSFGHTADDTAIYAAWNALQQTRPGGEPRLISNGMSGYTVRPDGGQVAFAQLEDGGGELVVADTSSGEVLHRRAFDGRPILDPIEYVGHRIAVRPYTSPDQPTPVSLWDPADDSMTPLDGVRNVSDASPATGAYAAVTDQADDQGRPVTELRAANGTVLWNTSEYAVRDFSPDGEHVVATDARPGKADAEPDRTVTVLNSETGEPVHVFRADDARQPRFDADGNVILVEHEAGDAAIIACDITGSNTDTNADECGTTTTPVRGRGFILPDA